MSVSMVRRSGKKVMTFITPTLIFVRQQSIFRATQNVFNQYNTYLYTTRTIFCQHVFLFCATCNTFSLSIGFHINFLLPQHILCESNKFRAQRNFYVKDSFVDTTWFFMEHVGNVGIEKEYREERKQMLSH